jgi:hypothetical protein
VLIVAEFAFDCLNISPARFAASPTLAIRLRIAETTGTAIQAIALRCQIRIEPAGRRYRPDERELLSYLFGEPSRWGRTMRAFQFATVSAMVPSFVGSTELELPLPVSYDLEVTAGKYFHALHDGVIPLSLLFSGTVFGATSAGMSVEPVPWHLEAGYRMPVAVWRELMDAYFPGEAWVRLRRETVDAVTRFQLEHAIPTWDAAVTRLLSQNAVPRTVTAGAPSTDVPAADRTAATGASPAATRSSAPNDTEKNDTGADVSGADVTGTDDTGTDDAPAAGGGAGERAAGGGTDRRP